MGPLTGNFGNVRISVYSENKVCLDLVQYSIDGFKINEWPSLQEIYFKRKIYFLEQNVLFQSILLKLSSSWNCKSSTKKVWNYANKYKKYCVKVKFHPKVRQQYCSLTINRVWIISTNYAALVSESQESHHHAQAWHMSLMHLWLLPNERLNMQMDNRQTTYKNRTRFIMGNYQLRKPTYDLVASPDSQTITPVAISSKQLGLG